MIILSVHKREEHILESSANRICGFFCNQIVLLLLVQYGTGDFFFLFGFSALLCVSPCWQSLSPGWWRCLWEWALCLLAVLGFYLAAASVCGRSRRTTAAPLPSSSTTLLVPRSRLLAARLTAPAALEKTSQRFPAAFYLLIQLGFRLHLEPSDNSHIPLENQKFCQWLRENYSCTYSTLWIRAFVETTYKPNPIRSSSLQVSYRTRTLN